MRAATHPAPKMLTQICRCCIQTHREEVARNKGRQCILSVWKGRQHKKGCKHKKSQLTAVASTVRCLNFESEELQVEDSYQASLR